MALGKRIPSPPPLFVSAVDLAALKPHPYYDALNKVLAAHHFDPFVEQLCAPFYAGNIGRPGLAPGVYFRCLIVGYLEGLDSERGIAWRCADSFSLKRFLGFAIDETPPDHSTLSRTRRLISLEAHAEVFQFMLKVLANHGLIDGKTLGVDSTTLEANAAMKSIVRRDTNEGYTQFLERLAKESGIETPSREDLARLDKKRKNKASNDDWENPNDPEAKITQMKDGTTHLAHKAEHAIDLGEDGHGALLAVNVCDAAVGDTNTLIDTIVQATRGMRSTLRSLPIHDRPRPPASDDPRRVLLRPAAFLKLMFCCHAAATEIGGFGISSAINPLVIEAFALVAQTCSSVTVAFDDASVADHAERFVDAGIGPDRTMRIWIHTHPGESTTPSMTDEQTFARSFGGCDWSAMLIVGRGSERYCRLQFTAGPGTSVLVPVRFDWASLPAWLLEHAQELPAIVRGWATELDANVRVDPTCSDWLRTADETGVGRGFWFDEPGDLGDLHDVDDLHDLDSLGDLESLHELEDAGDGPGESDHVPH